MGFNLTVLTGITSYQDFLRTQADNISNLGAYPKWDGTADVLYRMVLSFGHLQQAYYVKLSAPDFAHTDSCLPNLYPDGPHIEYVYYTPVSPWAYESQLNRILQLLAYVLDRPCLNLSLGLNNKDAFGDLRSLQADASLLRSNRHNMTLKFVLNTFLNAHPEYRTYFQPIEDAISQGNEDLLLNLLKRIETPPPVPKPSFMELSFVTTPADPTFRLQGESLLNPNWTPSFNLPPQPDSSFSFLRGHVRNPPVLRQFSVREILARVLASSD